MSIFVPESPGLLLAANSTIPTMIKQILAKLPRKSSKSNQNYSDGSNATAARRSNQQWQLHQHL
ncbi:hypothetical protein HanHA89_Chr10g0403281 [Helianthus annuus]|nr:hypothetical protein HanHA89_Chr10g0403281 [Helianthus annuus]